MIHESAHTLQAKIGETNPSFEKAWTQAIKSDNTVPSLYGSNNPREDFAEFMVIYNLTKGTSDETAARNLYPARYDLLNDVINRGKQ